MLRKKVSQYFATMQQNLFPDFAKELGPTTHKHLQVLIALDVIDVEKFIPYQSHFPMGRPPVCRAMMARAFIAKSVLGLPSTEGLMDRLKVDQVLRRICGFEGKLPSLGTFSNCFGEFAKLEIARLAHESLIREVYEGKLVGHVSRDSTAIDSREKPSKKEGCATEHANDSGQKKGRSKKGESRQPKEPTRIQRQLTMTVEQMLSELPTVCDVGSKKNSKDNPDWWIGYKLHLDVDDHGIPLTAVQ